MTPVFSAIGMKLSGMRRPSRGWFQRSSASAPTTSPVTRLICGWKASTNSPRMTASVSAFSVSTLLWCSAARISSNRQWRPPPFDLARYMAMSAARIKDSMLDPWSGEMATPIEAPMSTLCEHSSNGSEIASTTRRAIRSISSGEAISGKNMVNSSPARRASNGRGPRIAGELGVDDHPQAVGDHDQQLVAAGVAEAVVDHLEAVEIDEQHRAFGRAGRFAEQFVGLGAEMEAIGQRRHRIVHAERVGVFDRGADFGEQGCRRRAQAWACDLRTAARSRRDEVAVLDRHQPVAKRGQRAGAFAVGPLRGDVADQKAEDAGHQRRDDLLVELGDEQEGDQRKQEGGKARCARQDRVADLLRRASFHIRVRASRAAAMPPDAIRVK